MSLNYFKISENIHFFLVFLLSRQRCYKKTCWRIKHRDYEDRKLVQIRKKENAFDWKISSFRGFFFLKFKFSIFFSSETQEIHQKRVKFFEKSTERRIRAISRENRCMVKEKLVICWKKTYLRAKTLNCSSNIISSWVRNLKKKQKKINSVKKTDENKECFKNSIMPTATSLQNTFNFTNPMPSFFINPLMMHFQNPLQRTFFFPMNDWNYYDFHY